MRIIKVTNVEKFAAKILPKQPQSNKTVAQAILKDVKKNGDAAVKRYEKKFNKADITVLRLSQKEIKDAYYKISKTQLAALQLAKSKLIRTESSVKSLLKDMTINADGIKISKKFIPLASVGCYVPGGLAKYPSSAIMSVIPAKIAGVKRIVVVSPPNSDGKIDPLTIVTADICGANEIYKTGGVQSIAALSFGTRSIPKVDKIVGPGGAFVTAAKYLVNDIIGIDMLAGPTELGIIADGTANPKLVALDLISQAEHSNDTMCYLITTSEKLAISVRKIISELIPKVRRGKIIKFSLEKNGFIGICKTRTDMIKLANILAPEHLQIMTRDPKSISANIVSSGLVLIGENTPSSASDYILGSNHILPTSGFGKIRGSLSVLDFLKVNTELISSKQSLKKISKPLKTLTEAEGLYNHYEAVRGRLN